MVSIRKTESGYVAYMTNTFGLLQGIWYMQWLLQIYGTFMELYMGKPQEKHFQGSPRLQLQNSCSQPFQLTLSTLKKKNEIKLDWSNIQ